MTIERVISGGQTGTDQAALLAARARGLETGGWAPLGWYVEAPGGKGNISAPWLADYGLAECPVGGTAAQRYAARRRRNVNDADVILLLGDRRTAGSIGLLNDNMKTQSPRPLLWVEPGVVTPRAAADFLGRHPAARVLLVAGNRESTHPGIGERAFRFLDAMFRRLAAGRAAPQPGESHA